SRFEFTNLVCSTLDKKFGEFEYCHIKSINRSYKYISGKLKLYKLPMTKLMTETRFEFTNFVCTSYDKKFGEFEYCFIKSINRSYKYISGKFNVSQVPLTKIKANIGLWKRFNGYKPFLYNITFEYCAFRRNPKSNPIANFIYGSFVDYTNMNHTCPINHGVTLDKLPVDFVNNRFTRVLSFPTGDYLVKIHWLIGNFVTASADVYGTLS
ncbi:hypothetical protein KR059_010075, partial [Drosophila kikkawai]